MSWSKLALKAISTAFFKSIYLVIASSLFGASLALKMLLISIHVCAYAPEIASLSCLHASQVTQVSLLNNTHALEKLSNL